MTEDDTVAVLRAELTYSSRYGGFYLFVNQSGPNHLGHITLVGNIRNMIIGRTVNGYNIDDVIKHNTVVTSFLPTVRELERWANMINMGAKR